jgi:hypothetical protein
VWALCVFIRQFALDTCRRRLTERRSDPVTSPSRHSVWTPQIGIDKTQQREQSMTRTRLHPMGIALFLSALALTTRLGAAVT